MLVQLIVFLYLLCGTFYATTFLIVMAANKVLAEEGRSIFGKYLPMSVFVVLGTIFVYLFWPLVLLAKERYERGRNAGY